MLVPGRSRQELSHTLSAAYAHGLLSEDTFAARIDQLAAPTIEPSRLVGDIRLRRARTAWAVRAAEAIGRRVDRITESLLTHDGGEATLLALDWSGARTELLLGRHVDCDVVLPGPEISRRHARLRFRDGRWILQDLESRNGTIVNGERVGRCELRPGDRIAIGARRFTVD